MEYRMENLLVNGIAIPYEIKRSRKAKRINLTVRDNLVRVSLPWGTPIEEARTFVELKKEWVLAHVQAFQRREREKIARKFSAGEKFPYLGGFITLQIRMIPNKQIKVILIGDVLWISLPTNLVKADWPCQIRGALFSWYKDQAKVILGEKIVYYAEMLGVSYNQLRIKEQRTRWGSCSNKGNINLNWRIILAPEPVIDYLVLHEVAHLKQLNHSAAFWQLIEKNLPNYRNCKKWLREQGKNLFF